MSIRGQGAISFISLYDGTDKFQGVFHKGDSDEEGFSAFKEYADIGDFISKELDHSFQELVTITGKVARSFR